jgi:tRNA pseudouridine38-40 synthase
LTHTRYFFHIGFNGSRYRGWQIQTDCLNVQGVLETTLSNVLKEPVSIMGCGRTDALVHASQFFFHADIQQEWDYDLVFRLNKVLPADISVFEIIKMHPAAHARFDATARTYDYFIHTYKDPFLNNVSSLYLLKDPDLIKMKQAIDLLPLYNDYRSYCTSPSRYRTTICNIVSAKLMADTTGDRIRFQVTANRFLGSMIRILVGKFLDIAAGTLTVEEFEHYLITQEPQKFIEPAHPQGLFLSNVKYPYLDIVPRTSFAGILQNNLAYWQAVS